MKVREVITYKEYFDDFFKKQPQKVRDKIIKVLDMSLGFGLSAR